MRKSINGLSILVSDQLELDPLADAVGWDLEHISAKRDAPADQAGDHKGLVVQILEVACQAMVMKTLLQTRRVIAIRIGFVQSCGSFRPIRPRT